MNDDTMPMYNSILISGRPVSGKSTLVLALSKIYDWEVFSVGKLWREEWERRYPNHEIRFDEYWAKTSMEENLEMDRKAQAILEKGNVIGDLRVSAITENLKVLKVFVDASITVRIERAKNKKEYSGLSSKEIRNILNKREKDELKMYRLAYGKKYDYRDPLNYHLVINAGILKLEEEVRIIMEAMK